MVFDAHVHVGYFPRKDGKGGEAYYWSPARLIQRMRWAGIEEFIFSSTNACWDYHAESMHPEAEEVLRLANITGIQAHPFFWLSLEYLAWDREFSRVPSFYEGLKLNGGESHWTEHSDELRHVLSLAMKRNWPVQIHTSKDDINGCSRYLPFCHEFPELRFDLAHGHPVGEACKALQECRNVWIDVSFMGMDEIDMLWHTAPDRVMYGSDFPAPKRYCDESCTAYMRRRQHDIQALGGDSIMHDNARSFIIGRTRP